MAAPPGHGALIKDVALSDGGGLSGQVLDTQGVPVAHAPVVVLLNDREAARVATDANGKFSTPALRGGIYSVSTPGSYGVYRLWAPRTAPPGALQGLLLVAGADVVRGQYGAPGPGGQDGAMPQGPLGKALNFISNHPLIFAGAAGAAIVAPIVLEDLEDDAS